MPMQSLLMMIVLIALVKYIGGQFHIVKAGGENAEKKKKIKILVPNCSLRSN